MQVRVLFFATLKDHIGTNEIRLELPDNLPPAESPHTVGDIRRALSERYPGAATHLAMAVAALNQEFAAGDDVVTNGDEVAFFPPVSGGSGEPDAQEGWPEVFRVTDAQIDLNELTRIITTPATGAVCLFSGAVRGETTSNRSAEIGGLEKTLRLEYEAYEPMAVAKMRQVAQEIRTRWPLVQGIVIVQRVGRLAVGEPTILIACASGHRDQGCFEAARYGIDRLKEIVPVWKKEIGLDAERWIEGHYTPTVRDRADNPSHGGE